MSRVIICDGCEKTIVIGYKCEHYYLGDNVIEKINWEMQQLRYIKKHLCEECMNKITGVINVNSMETPTS